MIVVTGAAGFIGSAIIWKLNRNGREDIIAVVEKENLTGEKKLNLENLEYGWMTGKREFLEEIKNGNLTGDIEAVIHMGACSKTTETDRDYVMDTNYRYTKQLAGICISRKIRFIYASSAATYGDGSEGFDDSHNLLKSLKPLNLYGESKHRFDIWALENGLLDRIAGLKYFNVYGPNEYHKGEMKSFVPKAYRQIKETGKVKLFKSYHDKYADGQQVRDFIYVKDVVDMTLNFLDKKATGIFNIGTGQPRSWDDLVKAVFKALGKKPNIEYIDMPENIKGQYQYFTKADMNKYRAAGLKFSPRTLEEGISDYVKNYLNGRRRLGEK
ncbi:MAG: ADP-glyceromanno-heptose 6-epimerase [Elusimicrobiota bacterium]